MKFKKILLITPLLVATINVFGQGKLKQVWENVGGQYWGLKQDTSIITLALKGKDSTSVKISTDNCSWLISWIDYGGKAHNNKNMIRKSISADFWRWQKNYTIVGKDTIKREKPYWETMSGMGYNYSGFYTQNGKFVQPKYVIDKYGKHEVN